MVLIFVSDFSKSYFHRWIHPVGFRRLTFLFYDDPLKLAVWSFFFHCFIELWKLELDGEIIRKIVAFKVW